MIKKRPPISAQTSGGERADPAEADVDWGGGVGVHQLVPPAARAKARWHGLHGGDGEGLHGGNSALEGRAVRATDYTRMLVRSPLQTLHGIASAP